MKPFLGCLRHHSFTHTGSCRRFPPQLRYRRCYALFTSTACPPSLRRLSPELKKRAVEARARLAAEGSGAAEEARRARVEALAARKQQKLQEEKVGGRGRAGSGAREGRQG